MQMNLGVSLVAEPTSPCCPACTELSPGPGISFQAHPHALHPARTGISLPSRSRGSSPGTIPWLDRKSIVPALPGLLTLVCHPRCRTLLPAGQPCSWLSPEAVLLRDRWRCARLQHQHAGPGATATRRIMAELITSRSQQDTATAARAGICQGWPQGLGGEMQMMLSPASSAHGRILQLGMSRA